MALPDGRAGPGFAGEFTQVKADAYEIKRQTPRRLGCESGPTAAGFAALLPMAAFWPAGRSRLDKLPVDRRGAVSKLSNRLERLRRKLAISRSRRRIQPVNATV